MSSELGQKVSDSGRLRYLSSRRSREKVDGDDALSMLQRQTKVFARVEEGLGESSKQSKNRRSKNPNGSQAISVSSDSVDSKLSTFPVDFQIRLLLIRHSLGSTKRSTQTRRNFAKELELDWTYTILGSVL